MYIYILIYMYVPLYLMRYGGNCTCKLLQIVPKKTTRWIGWLPGSIVALIHAVLSLEIHEPSNSKIC
jgi:hypothetical protein